MFEDAKRAISSSSPSSSVYIGADSIRYRKNNQWWAKYSTVIVLHIDSKHGCKLFHRSVDMLDYGSLKQRLLTEVMYAIEAASEVIEEVGNRHLEIHIDVNPSPKHKSSIAVKEALGYVKGSLGLDAVIKPASWAASHAADHLVRNNSWNS
jgi:predicted RNase H-related nuclease YkuK (DUF458 family)